MSSLMEVDPVPSGEGRDFDEDSLSSFIDESYGIESDEVVSDDDFAAIRDEALRQIGDPANFATFSAPEQQEPDPFFPGDFITLFNHVNRPRTMAGVVDVSDSDSDNDLDNGSHMDPICCVPSCKSRRRVKARSRLITSYFSLNYMESPIICHKCFIKAVRFFSKISKIGPEKCKFLVNDRIPKATEFIDISEDGPSTQGEVKMLEDGSLPTEVCKNIHMHLNNVSDKYNIEDRYNKLVNRLEHKIGKITVWANELNSQLNMDDSSMAELLQDIYKTYSAGYQSADPVNTDIVNADDPEAQQMLMPKDLQRHSSDKSTIVIDSYSDPDVAFVEHCMESSIKKPSNLPPRGIIVRKKPSVDQKIFVKRQGDHVDWVPATVQSIIINENDEHQLTYRYKVHLNNLNYVKEVTEDQMAYFEPSPVRIAVGNRVISSVHSNQPSGPAKYYSGIIAETPSSNNQYRYMIMFDTMAVQYSNHEDVRVTCEMKERIHLYFPPAYQNFIQRYFEQLPTRDLSNINTMDIVKVESKGHWVDAKVTAIDGLLMKVFYSHDQPTEWIYRGSPRVLTKEKYEKRLIRNLAGGLKPKPHSCELMAEDDPRDVLRVKEMISQKVVSLKIDKPYFNLARAVAKKTVTRLNEPPPLNNAFSRGSSIYQNRIGKDEFAGFIKFSKDLGMKTLFPKDMGPHDCDENCILWTNRSLDDGRGKNPLVVPMIFAFKRVDVNPMGGAAKQIYYESPCGKKIEDFDQLLVYLQKTKCQLSVDHFNFDPWVNVWDEFIAAPGGMFLSDLSYGKEFNKIPVVNTVDKMLPPYLDYKVSRIATEGVPLNLNTDFLICCDCTDDCSNKMKCPCWQKTIKDYLDLIVRSNSEIDPEANVMDYSYIGYQNKRLVEHVPSGIYECNSMCKCKHTCLNRVVQQPLKVKLELFKTKYKGWGTRCLNDIPAGGFISVYVGNILTEKSANEDGKTYGDEYFAELDYIEVMERLMNKPGYESGPSDPENSDEEMEEGNSSRDMVENSRLRSSKKEKDKDGRLRRSTADSSLMRLGASKSSEEPKPGDQSDAVQDTSASSTPYKPLRSLYGNDESVYIIDAKSAGNIGRYFNHSCEPNIFVQNVFVDTHDLRFPWVAFFAKQHIRAGSELTWDYQYMVDSVPGKKLYCYCGSKSCRRRLL